MKSFRSFLTVLTFGAVVLGAGAETPSPLPPLQTVIQRVMQTSAEENAQYHVFNQHYYYQRERVTEFFDGSGNLKSREQKQTTNDPNRSVVIARPQSARQTLSMADRKMGAQPPSIHGVSLGKKEDLINPDLIKRYIITITGRETINGRPALVVDFKPASKDLPVLNIKDRFLNCVAGRAWVDEGDYVLEKVQLHLTQKVSVLGGLAGTVSKFTFSFDRDRTPDGYWFTRDLDWHIEAREATFDRLVTHHEEVMSLQKAM